LGEPREEDAGRNDRVVDGDEVSEPSDDHLFGDGVSGDGHGQWMVERVGDRVGVGACLLFLDRALDAATAMEGRFGGGGGGASEVEEGAGWGCSGEEDGCGCRGQNGGGEEEE